MRSTLTRASLALHAAVSITLVACGAKPEKTGDVTSGQTATSTSVPTAPDTGLATDGSDAPPPPPAHDYPTDASRSAAPASTTAKVEPGLYFERKGVGALYALDARPLVPSWSSSWTGDAARTRDDDLLTGVSCLPAADKPCALTFGFPEVGKVRALRLAAAFGPRWRDYIARPRPERIRMHTDAGSVDLSLSDGAAPDFILLAEAVATRSVTVEFLDAHGKLGGEGYFFGELEVYGEAGVARAEPIDVAPSRLRFYYEAARWKESEGRYTGKTSWVEQVGDDGSAQRLVNATAVYGVDGDRALLFETLRQTDCKIHDGGSFVLLDRKTRLWVDIGRMGGLHSIVWRHAAGLGFAVGEEQTPGSSRTVAGVVFEDGKWTRKRVRKTGYEGGSQATQLEAWGMAAAHLRPDVAATVEHVTDPCTQATIADLSALSPDEEGLEGGVERWMSCDAGGAKVLVYAPQRCPGAWHYTVVASDGRALGSKRGPTDGRSIRVARAPVGGLFLELDEKGGDDGSLIHVAATGEITKVGAGIGYSLRLPGACGCAADETRGDQLGLSPDAATGGEAGAGAPSPMDAEGASGQEDAADDLPGVFDPEDNPGVDETEE